MFSTATIEKLNRDAARRSRERGEVPTIPKAGTSAKDQNLKIPSLGDRTPRGWKRVSPASVGCQALTNAADSPDETYGCLFVDSSGFGSESEPALTLRRVFTLMDEVNAIAPNRYGYAVVRTGQFQVSIGIFSKR